MKKINLMYRDPKEGSEEAEVNDNAPVADEPGADPGEGQ